MRQTVTQGSKQAFSTERSSARPPITAAIPVCETSRKVRWHFLLSLPRTGNVSFLSVCQGAYSALLNFQLRRQPGRKHLAEKNQMCKSKAVHHSSAKVSILYCTCIHTTEMHSSGVTGRMQIGLDSSRAMIYWVSGTTHEWRCSTTHSKSPIPHLPVLIPPYYYKASAPSLNRTSCQETFIFPLLPLLHSI